jgi:hypothetical protein
MNQGGDYTAGAERRACDGVYREIEVHKRPFEGLVREMAGSLGKENLRVMGVSWTIKRTRG